jgi:segregation and condensation protein B
MELKQISTLESILYLSNKPVAAKELAKVVGVKPEEVVAAMDELAARLDKPESGVRLMRHEGSFQIVTAPDNASEVEAFFHADLNGELTKPALETLTIIAYRGPISKPELELIRGVNCSLILRNLSMRALISSTSSADDLAALYTVTPEFLQFLGMTSTKELPEYDALHAHELLDELLKQRTEASQ